MPSDNSSSQTSPFEIVNPGKAKKGGRVGVIVGILIVVFLVLSVVAGVLLVRQQQNVSEKAAGGNCNSPSTIVQCPRSDGALVSCDTPDANNNAQISLCNELGRTTSCGGKQYCCPSAGGSWTTDMSKCSTTGTVAACGACTSDLQCKSGNCDHTRGVCEPSSGCSASPSPSATPTLTPTPTATAIGNACNGSCGSNTSCQSGLYCYSGSCRNPLCSSDATCGCGSTMTPTPTAVATTSSVTTTQTTPRPIPVTGTNWPTVLGIGTGAAAIIASLILAI